MFRRRGPVGGIDYPKTDDDFRSMFWEDQACSRYLRDLRWPRGFQCPRCGMKAHVRLTERDYSICPHCGTSVSVTKGTLFERSRFPLGDWFKLIWRLTNTEKGLSAKSLQRDFGIHSYQTAWSLLHRLRRAMVHSGPHRLDGRVEAGQISLGTARVLVAVEIPSRRKLGELRMRQIHDEANQLSFICKVVKIGSVVSARGIEEELLSGCGYRPAQVSSSSSAGRRGEPGPNGVRRVGALVKHWLWTTHRGSFSGKHLDYYLDEYAFRFNHRRTKKPGLLFYNLIKQAVKIAPLSYRQLVKAPSQIDPPL